MRTEFSLVFLLCCIFGAIAALYYLLAADCKSSEGFMCSQLKSGSFGFISDSFMKNGVLSLEKSVPSVNNYTEEKEFYVNDKSYCGSHEKICPPNRTCLNMIGGRYLCKENEVLQNSINVVIAVDKSVLPAVLPLLLSIKEHNKESSLLIHVVISDEDRKELEKLIYCGFSIPDNIQIDVVELYLPETMKQLIFIRKNATQYLSSPGNFVRFYFDHLFPYLNYILYLDIDTIVKHNLDDLWTNIISTDKLLVVVPRKTKTIGSVLNPLVATLYHERYGKQMNLSSTSFNAGVLGINLEKWRKKNLTKEIIYWMSENKKKPLWDLGTQPIIHVLSYGDCKFVNWRWNLDRLGRNAKISAEHVSKAYILHWNGLRKPWLKQKKGSNLIAKHIHVWKKYDRKMCNGRGKCIQREGRAVCKCQHRFKGDTCEIRI